MEFEPQIRKTLEVKITPPLILLPLEGDVKATSFKTHSKNALHSSTVYQKCGYQLLVWNLGLHYQCTVEGNILY